jgi:predicted metal-dependent phosphoesterase TrpH
MKNLLKQLTEADYYKTANLHIHTNFSDGKLSPQEIIKLAEKKGLKYISITDHNTLDAYKRVAADLSVIPKEKDDNLQVITGIEFDCWYKSNFMHILGYGIDLNNEKLNSFCAKSKKETELDIVRIFAPRRAPEIISAIKEAGGVAILAHPCCCWNLNLRKMVTELKNFGLDGLEAYYPYIRHRAVVKFHRAATVKKLANELDLLVSGGTDCHKDDL